VAGQLMRDSTSDQRRRLPTNTGPVLRWCSVLAGVLGAGSLSFGCAASGTSSSTTSPQGPLRVHVSSVSPIPAPFIGAPVEQVTFTVSRPTSSSASMVWTRCNIEVLHAGSHVGGKSITYGGPLSASRSGASVGIPVKGGVFNGQPSDAQVSCQDLKHHAGLLP